MTRIPPELTDRIIDFLHSDRQALATCALVCKSWIPSSRLHLFETLYLTSSKILKLTHFLDSNDSTIERHVRTLKVVDGWVVFGRLAQHLSRFPALKSLILHGVHIDIHELDDPCLWFHGITNLDVMSFYFKGPGHFCRFLNAFPLLEMLRADFSYLGSHFSTGGATISLPLCIRILHIVISSSILLNIHFPPLAELTLCNVATKDLVDINHWFRSLPPTLRVFNIRFSSYINRSFPRPSMPFTRSISDVFRQIPTTLHLSKVEIAVLLHCITDVYDGAEIEFDFDWDILSQVLVQPRFSTLQRVSVCAIIRPEHSDVTWRDDLLERMSTLRSRGILSITESLPSLP